MEVFEASTDAVVRVITVLCCALLLGVAIYGVMQYRGSHNSAGVIAAGVAALILALSYLYSVKRYSVDAEYINIIRPIGTIRIPREGTRVYRDPGATDGAIRVWGNGGLFSIAGLFYNKQLGWLHAYLRNSRNIVVVQHSRSIYLVSPDQTDKFIAAAGR